MSKRYFTSDFHLGMNSIIGLENRPFLNVCEMNSKLVKACETTKSGDIIIHAGDLACFGENTDPVEMLKDVKADFINIRGNHDLNNKIKSVCESMTIRLGQKYPNVVIGHYPSYDPRASNYIKDGWICLCGHVHGKWKHCLDLNRKVLNINIGVDVWKYRIIPEEELCQYIGKLLTHRPDRLYRCFLSKGKLKFQGEKDLEKNVKNS